ncbi:hypothetical protein V6N11_059290 [Hibiscus sabdariffa]|uniref:Uncharacterized protein n=1 Tax=Hibiscus sabdariffa TaxID=183260 RepID=A0ABR2U6Z4_9ROSI
MTKPSPTAQSVCQRQSVGIQWLPPPFGWVKLNSDGSRAGVDGHARRGWSISYLYVPRNGNRVIDASGTRVNIDSLELVVLEEPPVYVVHLLHEDLVSASISF